MDLASLLIFAGIALVVLIAVPLGVLLTRGAVGKLISPVVVGIDGSEGSMSALDWAAGEAARAGADLQLVAVVEHLHVPRFPLRLGHDDAVNLLDRLATSVHDRVPAAQVSTEVYEGHAATAILEHLEHARLVVVGKRGLSTLPRLIVGSTSLAVAGRATVPAAVVPTGWDEGGHQDGPIVVGVDPYRESRRLLQLAFRRAERLDVPLVAVHGWEAPSAPVWTDSPIDEWERESHEEFHAVLRQMLGELKLSHFGVFQQAAAFPGQTIVLHVEPDLWGFLQQRAREDDARRDVARAAAERGKKKSERNADAIADHEVTGWRLRRAPGQVRTASATSSACQTRSGAGSGATRSGNSPAPCRT